MQTPRQSLLTSRAFLFLEELEKLLKKINQSEVDAHNQV